MSETLTLNDYLPVLNHPEHGGAICEAAGVAIEKDPHWPLWLKHHDSDDDRTVDIDEPLQQYVIAALRGGLLKWMAEQDRAVTPTKDADLGWRVMFDVFDEMGNAYLFCVVGDTLDAAIIKAAKRCMGVE